MEENAALKAAHDATKPTEAPKVEATTLTREALKMPEGFETDDKALGAFVDLMNDASKSPAERAQALIDLQAEVMKGVSERANQAFTDMQVQWQDEVQADPVVGGDKLEPTLGRINQLVDTYAEPAKLKEAFVITGMGNNPHMIRWLNQIALQLAEGKPTPGGSPPAQAKSVAERLFPSMKQG